MPKRSVNELGSSLVLQSHGWRFWAMAAQSKVREMPILSHLAPAHDYRRVRRQCYLLARGDFDATLFGIGNYYCRCRALGQPATVRLKGIVK